MAAESERRCNHALKLCDRLEGGGGVAICCCGTHALCSPVADQGVGFENDGICDGLIGARLLCSHVFCPQGAVGRCFASSRLARFFFFDRVQIQRNTAVCAASDCRNPMRGRTCWVVGPRWGIESKKLIAHEMPRGARVYCVYGGYSTSSSTGDHCKCNQDSSAFFSANILSHFFNARALA